MREIQAIKMVFAAMVACGCGWVESATAAFPTKTETFNTAASVAGKAGRN